MNPIVPEDVLGEILVRLPIKSLFRFCCVSKTWCNLINSPYFADMHLMHTKNHNYHHHRGVLLKRFIKNENKTLLSSYSDHELRIPAAPDMELPLKFPNFTYLCGTCNGIVCIVELATLMNSKSNKNVDDTIYLCNPATRQFLILPPSPLACLDVYDGDDVDRVSFGFEFDPSTNDYKVVRFIFFAFKENRTEIEAEIYHLRTNSWRRLDIPPPAISYPYPIQSVPASLLKNGSLIMHWCGIHQYDRWSYGILCFNMCTEAIQEMQCPCRDISGGFTEVAVLDDCLACILMRRTFASAFEQAIDVWVMMEYGIKESWIKKFSIEPLSSFQGCTTLRSVTPLFSWKNDILVLQTPDGHLFSCSLHSNYCRKIWRCDTRNLRDIEVIAYDEALVSLGEMGNGLPWRKM